MPTQGANHSEAAITKIADFLKKSSGLVVPDHKRYLFDQRLAPLLAAHGLESLDALAGRIGSDAGLRREVVHSMTTHETSFFRDGHPFQALEQEVLPNLMRASAQRKKSGAPTQPFQIWCAACSTGQEPYTVAMLVREIARKCPDLGCPADAVRILATDISHNVLDEARTGRYDAGMAQRGIPERLRDRYFSAAGDSLEVDAAVRKMVTFRQMNLAAMFTLGPFDLVLLRNVLIYFDEETKVRVLERVCQCLAPNGRLLLGSSESPPRSLEDVDEVKHGRSVFYGRVAA